MVQVHGVSGSLWGFPRSEAQLVLFAGQNFQQAVPATSIVDPSGAPLHLGIRQGNPRPTSCQLAGSCRKYQLSHSRISWKPMHFLSWYEAIFRAKQGGEGNHRMILRTAKLEASLCG